MNARPDFGYNPARVLIVDDERHNRELLKVLLAPKGYVLSTANDGEEALTAVALEAPDLILLDVMMPGVDGFDLTERLKADATTRNIPIIMITALDDQDSRMRGLTAGVEDFLTKPVNQAELSVKVRNLLRLKAYGEYYDNYSRVLEGEVETRTAELAERARHAAVLAEQAALIDLAQDAIVVLDTKGGILSWSRGAEKLYGWASHEAIGRNARELLRTICSESSDRIDAALLTTGHWQGEATQFTRCDEPLTVASRWAMRPDADGTTSRVLTISNDITHLKQAESALKLLSGRLSLAASVAEIGVWDWDVATQTMTWDATMLAIYGLPSASPPAGNSWAAAVHPQDLRMAAASFRRAIEQKDHFSLEFRIVRPNGSIRSISAVGQAVVDADSVVRRVIGVQLDITERKHAEAALEQLRSDQLKFKDDFLSHVSHELRSPLTAIRQFASILSDGLAGKLNPEQQQYQEIILKNVHQLQSMIDDLLEVTRLETGKLTIESERVSVAEAVADALQTLEVSARGKGVTLSCELDEDLPPAYADHTRLRQALIILLDNAIKFTPPGGRATIRARVFEPDPRFVLVEVADTGCGVRPEMREVVFDRLYQASDRELAGRQGLGLGLHICKELVTRQGGTIWIDPEQHPGSTFRFTLLRCTLENLIAPLFRNGSWPAESLSLVVVERSPLGSRESRETQAEVASEIRGMIRGCLDPAQSLLLPAWDGESAQDHFVVAVFAPDRTAARLAHEIRGQFGDLPPAWTGRSLSVTHTPLPPCLEELGPSAVGTVARMARHLEASIRSHLSQETSHHEQQAHSGR